MVKHKTSSTAKNKYNAKAYDRILLVVPKGRKKEITAYAMTLKKDDGKRETVNGLINKLLRSAMGYTTDAEWKGKQNDE